MKEVYLTEELFKYYNLQAEKLLEFYNSYANKNSNPLFKIADVLVSFDTYYSSLIIKSLKKRKQVTSDEIKQLNLQLKYSSIFSHLLESESKYNVDDNLENIIKNADNVLTMVPLFIKMGVSIDKDLEKSHIHNEVTLSGIFYNGIRELLINYFEFDEIDLSDILGPIMIYYYEKKVSLRV